MLSRSRRVNVDELIKSGKEALNQDRYDNAKSYIKMASEEVEKRIAEIGKKLERRAESANLMGTMAEELEDLAFKKQTIQNLMDTIDQESNRANSFRKLVEGIRGKGIVDSILERKEKIDSILDAPRTLNPDDSFFLCLRKLNSYTPFISTSDKPRQGGGYFLVWKGKSMVIDPGINFLQNFLSYGYSISDIDAILLTHSHVDHTADFEAILTLLHERNSLRRQHGLEPYKPKVYFNIGAANKFMNLLSLSYENIVARFMLDPGFEQEVFPGLTLSVSEAYHSDLYCPKGKCVGALFRFRDKERSCVFGITSDTGYSDELKSIYSCLSEGIMVLHLGSILEDELQLEGPTKRIYPQHLGIRGAFNLIYDVHPRLAIISEVGEELQSCMCSLTDHLRTVFPETMILPADIGLRINLSKLSNPIEVECQRCKRFVDIANVTYSYCSDKEAIQYICAECERQVC